jgi:hypothetical protein
MTVKIHFLSGARRTIECDSYEIGEYSCCDVGSLQLESNA